MINLYVFWALGAHTLPPRRDSVAYESTGSRKGDSDSDNAGWRVGTVAYKTDIKP